jgi:hypothetical protein
MTTTDLKNLVEMASIDAGEAATDAEVKAAFAKFRRA